jgi:hypothetical protein
LFRAVPRPILLLGRVFLSLRHCGGNYVGKCGAAVLDSAAWRTLSS